MAADFMLEPVADFPSLWVAVALQMLRERFTGGVSQYVAPF